MVETTSGSVFTGSIVVGADGVHSRVAQEMQRFAEKEIPKLRLNPLNDGLYILTQTLNRTLTLFKDLNARADAFLACPSLPSMLLKTK
jgi:2-polyprenyl-6-methoxyphenol hydroxylase-like FAD-dependent oxidoreductase